MTAPRTELVASRAAAADAVLRRSLDEAGYLYLPDVLPPDDLVETHRAFRSAVTDAGWVADDDDGDPLGDAPVGRPELACASPEARYLDVYHHLYRVEAMHRLGAHPHLAALARRLLGGPTLRHPRMVGRIHFPGHPELATPPHQDILQVQGSPRTLTFWVPLHDCPLDRGPLAVSPGSHHLGVLAVEPALGASGAAVIGADDLPWAASPVRRGDVLVLDARMVHRSLPNRTDRFRFSIDTRIQPAADPVSERSLDFPATSDLAWDEITRGWQDPELVVGWRSLDLDLVAYDDGVNVDRDRRALELARAGDPVSVSAVQRIAAHATDPAMVAAAVELLRALGADVPRRAAP